jgi:hypothetical protein
VSGAEATDGPGARLFRHGVKNDRLRRHIELERRAGEGRWDKGLPGSAGNCSVEGKGRFRTAEGGFLEASMGFEDKEKGLLREGRGGISGEKTP